VSRLKPLGNSSRNHDIEVRCAGSCCASECTFQHTDKIGQHLNILRRIARTFRRESDRHHSAAVIDDLRDTGGSGDWRKLKLEEAAQKYGRPFKCAGDDMPHETMLRDRIVMTPDRTQRFYEARES
jgi:hypothetical protein